VSKIKKIKFTVFAPVKSLSSGKKYEIEIKENANFIEALALLDKYVFEHPDESPFPIYEGYIHSFLQLFWDPRINEIYDDCAVQAYGPNKVFIPLREKIESSLHIVDDILLQVDYGC